MLAKTCATRQLIKFAHLAQFYLSFALLIRISVDLLCKFCRAAIFLIFFLIIFNNFVPIHLVISATNLLITDAVFVCWFFVLRQQRFQGQPLHLFCIDFDELSVIKRFNGIIRGGSTEMSIFFIRKSIN